MVKEKHIQDEFLATLCKNQAEVAIYLINGIKLHGVIAAFDQFTVLLQKPTQQLVSKRAIATVMPLMPMGDRQ
jgi:host factor-I protein